MKTNPNRFRKISQILSGTKPTLYFLIGLPASGKSEWIRRNKDKIGSAVIINRDEIVKSKAKELQVGRGTYDDMFPRLSKEIVPPGMPPKEVWLNPERSSEVDNYYHQLELTATDYNSDPKNKNEILLYGELIPFEKDLLKKIIVDYGRDVNSLIPFTFKKIFDANEIVEEELSSNLGSAINNKKDIVIDMMSLSKGSRDAQRKKIVGFIEGVEADQASPENISKYYNQVAIVFVPETGYTPELISQIKEVNELRRIEEEAKGERKTIPDFVYKMNYEAPSSAENFYKIEYLGVTSLDKLKEKRMASLRYYFTKIAAQDFTINSWEDLEKYFGNYGLQIRNKWDNYIDNYDTGYIRSKEVNSFLDFFKKINLEELPEEARVEEEKLLPEIKIMLNKGIKPTTPTVEPEESTSKDTINKAKAQGVFGSKSPNWLPNGGFENGPQQHQKRHGKGFNNWQSNNGWDLMAPAGTIVHSLTKGKVGSVRPSSSGAYNVFGTHISINGLDGYPNTFYTHVDSVMVKPGDIVEVGTPLAQIATPPQPPPDKDGKEVKSKMPHHVHIGVEGAHISSLINSNGKFKNPSLLNKALKNFV